jgi:hypothetical protein
VLSPDGGRLATVIPNQFLVHDLQNGTQRRLPLGDARIQHLAWRGDRALVLGQPEGEVLWWSYDLSRWTREPLWTEGTRLVTSAGDSVEPAMLRELAWSLDGEHGAGVEPRPQGSRLWEFDASGRALSARSFPTRLGHPHWLRDGRIACLSLENGRQRVTLPCGEKLVAGLEERDAYGPIGSSPDGRELYVALANDSGFVGLWAWSVAGETERPAALRGASRHLRPVSKPGRDASLQGPGLLDRSDAHAGRRRPGGPTHGLSSRNAVMGSNRDPARHHLRDLAPGER